MRINRARIASENLGMFPRLTQADQQVFCQIDCSFFRGVT